ncbi:hypothetical protein [Cellulomonas fimi]|uniref:UspA domain-containing protein n=1 Tax=Cellulomonas fimi (strain ATCC 484 / DSM 20113 / JCM 1341 / CCUG 24087 / LMG 16345 / NBRC 15513 / NCIMB 8980 / NCTC 7547 / NRS-133) TaxID=590998 RepID=F4H101_CELFA|nr:hypothetical protein [Cellulomonas fimi]AEE46248.1 hypothetical protein Celf_2120 [Cellulomonas fimi ATCC 484]NNH06187.1 hypothetical protein [Cellulomonas fimi]VEH32226.1 Uncharacterised protein [Cellulomonas fimi]
MTDTILVLVEDTLTASDVQHLLSLHPDEELAYRVLVPADTERPLLSTIIDDLSMGELRQAFDRARGKEPSEHEARATAAEQLTGSLAQFTAAGRSATGEVTQDDPIPALRSAVAAGGVREVAVVTYPHALEDTFHRDWASRARDELRVPVLHLYAGTSELG